MNLDRIKSGKLKPKFVIAFEWMVLATVTILLLLAIAAQFLAVPQLAVGVFAFILLIETGILSVLYGVEGIRYRIIWLTYPTLNGLKRLGFCGASALFVGFFYALLGLALMIVALAYAYLNTGGSI